MPYKGTQRDRIAMSQVANGESCATATTALNSSVSAPCDAWAQEIAQRVAAYDRGDISAYAAEDVFAEAKLSVM
jgi:hypothetical protein